MSEEQLSGRFSVMCTGVGPELLCFWQSGWEAQHD